MKIFKIGGLIVSILVLVSFISWRIEENSCHYSEMFVSRAEALEIEDKSLICKINFIAAIPSAALVSLLKFNN